MPYVKPEHVDDTVYSAIHYAIDEGLKYNLESIIRDVLNSSWIYYASNRGQIEEYIRENWVDLELEAKVENLEQQL